MPNLPPARSARSGLTPVKAPAGGTSYVKFSDKLTDSLEDISRMIQDHKDMIDAIQEVALELTNSIGSLHTLTVKYAGIANAILDALLPIVRNLPLIPKNVLDMLINLESMTQKIIDNQVSTSKTIVDVQGGLRSGDVSKIKGHAGELQAVTKAITGILPK
jgi:hypothetical protein